MEQQLLSPAAAADPARLQHRHRHPHLPQHLRPHLPRGPSSHLRSKRNKPVRFLHRPSMDESLAESFDDRASTQSGAVGKAFDDSSTLEPLEEIGNESADGSEEPGCGMDDTGNDTEDTGNDACSACAVSRDPWEPWDEGPLLRADSFTAQQLFYITPEALHLESRRVFIGDFPENWVETHCSAWMKAVQKRMERLGIRDNEHENRRLYTALGIEEKRRVIDLQIAAELVENGKKAVHERSQRRSRLTRAMQRRRHGFRSKKLASVSIDSPAHDGPGSEPARPEPESALHELAPDESTSLASLEPTTKPASTKPASTKSASAKSASAKSTKPASAKPAPQPPTIVETTPEQLETDAASRMSSNTEFFDCDESPPPSLAPPRVVVFSTPSPSDSSLETASYESRATSLDGPGEDQKAAVMNDKASFKAVMASFRNFVSNAPRTRKLSTTSPQDPLSTDSAAPSLAPSTSPPLAPDELPSASKSSSSSRSKTQSVTHSTGASTATPATGSKMSTRSQSKTPSIAPSAIPSAAASRPPSAAPSRPPSVAPSRPPSTAPSRPSSAAPSEATGKPRLLKPEDAPPIPYTRSTKTRASSRRPSSVVQALLGQRWRPHNPLHRGKHRKEKIYQGRFLVQERESRSARPIIDEIEKPLATQLITRWKECAVYTKLTDDRHKPLMLYIYETMSAKKLARRTQRSWSRKLEYKIAIDPYYEFSFFSPLDLTLGLWRPRLAGERRHHHMSRRSAASHVTINTAEDEEENEKRDHTKILLFQAQSISAIMDLAFLFSSATNAAEHLHGPASWTVGLPSLDIHTLVKSDRTFSRTMDELRNFDGSQDRYVSYSDLLSPTASASSTFNLLMRTIYGATKNLLDRLELDGDGRSRKYTLAWVLVHRPLWLPTESSSLYPITRLNWLMRRHGNLVMIEPKPKCYLGNSLKEPAAVEGCALSVNMSFSSCEPLTSKFTNAVTMASQGQQSPAQSQAGSQTQSPTESKVHVQIQSQAQAESKAQSQAESKAQSKERSKSQSKSQRKATIKAWNTPQYIFTCDEYLLYAPSNLAEPPMLASSQNAVEKKVEPYPLDESQKHIPWIKSSTCLHELDYHDVVARVEHERRTKLVSSARGLLNLRFFDSFSVNDKGDLVLEGLKGRNCSISFGSREVAEAWAVNLTKISSYWKEAHKARIIQRAAVSGPDFTITPFLQNRAIVFSGSLFIKKHLFATFKPYHVLLTAKEMVIFRVDQKRRPPAHPNQNLPASSLHHQHYKNLSLQDSYIYTGQVANHVLLNDDSHIDPSNPGTRALPRAYEDGLISQDTELDRCFVVWQAHKQRFPMISSSNKPSFYAFLAQEKENRDQWVSAIRYVQTYLSAENDLTKAMDCDESDSEAEENAFFG